MFDSRWLVLQRPHRQGRIRGAGKVPAAIRRVNSDRAASRSAGRVPCASRTSHQTGMCRYQSVSFAAIQPAHPSHIMHANRSGTASAIAPRYFSRRPMCRALGKFKSAPHSPHISVPCGLPNRSNRQRRQIGWSFTRRPRRPSASNASASIASDAGRRWSNGMMAIAIRNFRSAVTQQQVARQAENITPSR